MNWLGNIAVFSVRKVAERVTDSVLSLVQSEVTQYRGVNDDFERLKGTSESIKALLTDAEERRYIDDKSAMIWLSELKTISLDADNLLDKYQIALRAYEHNSATDSSRKRKWYQMEISSITSKWGLARRRRFASEIDKINKRLEETAKRRKTLRLRGEDGLRREYLSHIDKINQRLDDIARGQQTMMMRFKDLTRHGSPHPSVRLSYHSSCSSDQMTIVGRQNEIDDIVNLLIMSDFGMCENLRPMVPVVPIHGLAGIGKTVIAKMVFNDNRICVYFDFKAWVTLTDVCDMRAVSKEIYQKMTGQRCDFTDADMLQKLREYLKNRQGNKFLLVIDNLCADDFCYWRTLQVPLLAGAEGSKVLITTRNEKICQKISSISRPSVTGLDEEECWQIIQSKALSQGIVSLEDKRLVPIGKGIAKRCNGFPMAATNLGALLNGKGEEVWSDVLCEMEALKDEHNVVLSSLRIRYHHFPYHLKQCFDYCSVFPKGYRFEKDQLIRQWMARGLISIGNGHQSKVIGMSYFDDLVSRSFFEKFPTCDKGRSEGYMLPSLMYDLARLNAEQEPMGFNCGLVLQEPESDQGGYASSSYVKNDSSVKINLKQFPTIQKPLKLIPATSPHFSILDLKDEVSTLFAPSKGNLLLELAVAQANCKSAPPLHFPKYLRILDLSKCNIEIFPDCVSNLIHLRYLNLSHSKIKFIPENVCSLFNLQTLCLKECRELMLLPKGMGRLINLQHLDLHLEWEDITDSTKVAIPQGISELNKLQTLSRFNVSSVKGQDCNLIELKDLNLSGDLCILNLETVPTSDDAMNANLRAKKHVEKLMLRWDSSAHADHLQPQLSEEVIDFLQPNNNLRCLWIINYPGIKFPNWMGSASFSRLEKIRISNCKTFNFLPLLGQLPWLKNLQIDNVPAETMRTPVGFPSLELLSLLNMPFLEKMYLENEIPQLKELYISDCPDLKELVLHESLHDKFEERNCPSLSTIVCVPHVEELPIFSASEEQQEVKQNSMYQNVVGNTVTERRDVSSVNELTEEEIETVGESIKEWLKKGKFPLAGPDNMEDERAAKRRKTAEKILQMVAAESCFNFQSDGTSSSSREVPGED